ncbi:Flp pilus assembly protein CpaB [Brenneria sp. 4F2]|nr:Flp pilus assembly protein CpaB [Brenneria bubanii]
MSSVLKFALILLAAAMLAVVARIWFVSSQNASPPPEKLDQVRVAVADLPAGLLLREGDLGWKAYSSGKVPEGALREGSTAANLNGALLRKPLASGELILAGNIIRPDAPGFLAAVLKPGMRAVSVPVDDVSGNAGLIQPGDFVDIILTQKLNQQENNHNSSNTRLVVSETVVERARIIAVGSSIQRQTEENGKTNRARTMTVEVAPRAAEAVTVAAQLGSLSMALRSFALEDRNTGAQADEQGATASVVAWDSTRGSENRPVWGGDVSRALGAREYEASASDSKGKISPPRSQRVIIMRGSQRQEQEFDTYAR